MDQLRDIFEGSHAEFAASESYVSPTEKRWLAWVAKVEQLLGHSLDGNQETDGYSLDYAGDAFSDGLTADQYATEVRTGILQDPPEQEDDDAGEQRCTNRGGHEFECTGTQYGGDDASYFGEGRCYCIHCGADGDG